MATKTLIRSKKPHEVKLVDGTQLAQSQQPLAGEEVPVPALIRKASGGSSTRRTAAVASTKAAAGNAKAPARKKVSAPAAPAVRAAKKTPAKSPSPAAAKTAKPAAKPAAKKAATPSPRLPARVPADGLWEADSAVNQRLQALIERNAQLSEQLQRIQSNALPKGYKP